MRITTAMIILCKLLQLFSICKDNKKDANHNCGIGCDFSRIVVFDMQR